MMSLSRIAFFLAVFIATVTVQGQDPPLPESSPNNENLAPERVGDCPASTPENGSSCSSTGGYTSCNWGETDTTGCSYTCLCNIDVFTCRWQQQGAGECSGVSATMSKDSSETDVDKTLGVTTLNDETDEENTTSSGPMASIGGIVSITTAAAAVATFTAFAL